MRLSFSDVVSGGLFACALVAVGLMIRRDCGSRGQTGNSSFTAVPVSDWETLSQIGNRIGAPTPSMTIVEFVDFECPACRLFERDVLGPFLAEHRDKVQLVVRHWPLNQHPAAMPMAIASECAADQGAFEQFYRYAFESANVPTVEYPGQVASLIGIPDTARFVGCVQSDSVSARIDRDILAVRSIGGTGTPTIVVDGLKVTGIPTRYQLDSLFAIHAVNP
ncbi:MAG: thioredoxin domain-containing protein [Gemmatimonadales bacterium]|nr:thioredoxin domain-containing protein [Gemmatimonadales bacterium]MDZ4390843.1 thioredoxin domain-containing protein [Gemmatimonadales bacterium]